MNKNTDSLLSQPPYQPAAAVEHECVDLGLSVRWAACNVGASVPEDYGDYFAWGETVTKEGYTEGNCSVWEKHIGDAAGKREHDVAHARWGGAWRLPTFEELIELKDLCTWVWTMRNGVNGYEVTGPNGNSIFLPAAGCCFGASLGYVGAAGYYWSATAHESSMLNAYCIYFTGAYHLGYWDYRYYGQSVRPVSD